MSGGRMTTLAPPVSPAEDFVTLACPPGAEGGKISHGEAEYVPYREDHTDPHSRWLVAVPREAARYFCGNGGFKLLAPGGR
jgi:hypothetical protein